MSDRPTAKLRILEEDPLWKEANGIAEYMYSKLAEFPEEEKWDTTSKIRKTASDLLFDVGQGVGSGMPNGAEFEWGSARRSASGLKTAYRFATRQKFIELEPSIMVRLNKLIAGIDDEIKAAHKMMEQADKAELDHWRERYNVWRKTTDI